MPAGLGPIAVLDTADWDLTVPLATPFDPTGSRLQATISPGIGGPAIAVISTDDGSLAWVPDPITGKAIAVQVHVPVAARDGWQAAQKTVLGLDLHRTVAGSTANEWFGAQTVTFQVYPASDSELAMLGAGFLYGGRPPTTGKAILSPLQVGPQGPPGEQGPAGASADQSAPIFTAGAALSGHMAVRAIGDGSVLYASADQPAQAGTVLGITNGAAQAGAQIGVVTEGPIDEPSWTWSPGPVWLGLNGALTQSVPMSGMVVRVGLALSPTRLLVGVAPAILL